MSKSIYNRVLLKLSGESLAEKDGGFGIDVEAIKNHCDAGTDVNEKDKYGDAPLHIAAVRTSVEVAKLLIEKGADVNIKTKWGRTPLAEAASVGSREIAELLIAEGADINAREKGGGTPLHQATFLHDVWKTS